jgi:hypothetical protein
MAHVQKPDFVFRQNGRVHLSRRGRQFSRLLEAEVCASVIVMLDTLCSEVVWRVLATHSICRFTLHFPSCASPRAITFQLDCITKLLFRTGKRGFEFHCLCNLNFIWTDILQTGNRLFAIRIHGSFHKSWQLFYILAKVWQCGKWSIYEACPEGKDTKVLNMYIFNLQKRHCEWITCT